MTPFSFKIQKRLDKKLGRAGLLTTPHGVIETPAFVTVGTKATVKAVTPEMLKSLGAQVVLANTYHLYLQPGDELVKKAGGLGKFMNWNGPTMTDSGGFQVFSLGAAFGKNISKIVKGGMPLELPESNAYAEDSGPRNVHIEREGVMFRSHLDGSSHYFTPEKSIEIQHNLGADIIFAFDECTSPTESQHYQREALDRTHLWAKKSLDHHKKLLKADSSPALFGIVQGGRIEHLRKESAQVIGGMDFDGFGIGGSFAKEDMTTAVQWVNEILPEDKPRHLLGIGEPEDLFMGVENGVDLFDCVAPTRNARNGSMYTKRGRINIMNAKYVDDFSKIEEDCGCYTCANYTLSYLAHLFRSKEMLAGTLATIHNLYFIVNLVKGMRGAILDGKFPEFKRCYCQKHTDML